jgi:hypothetical protein
LLPDLVSSKNDEIVKNRRSFELLRSGRRLHLTRTRGLSFVTRRDPCELICPRGSDAPVLRDVSRCRLDATSGSRGTVRETRVGVTHICGPIRDQRSRGWITLDVREHDQRRREHESPERKPLTQILHSPARGRN